MAPARMMQFVDLHISDCQVCQEDPGIAEEVDKIRDFVVPESKIPKAVRVQEEKPTTEISPDEDEDEETDDKDENEDNEDNKDDAIEGSEENLIDPESLA